MMHAELLKRGALPVPGGPGRGGSERETLMAIPLRILMLGEDALESARVEGVLASEGYEPAVVHVAQSDVFGAELLNGPWDLILGDGAAKSWDPAAALALARTHAPDVPFVVIADAAEDKDAIAWVRKGAADFVRRDSLHRLPAAVAREMRDTALRRERNRASEEVLQAHVRWASLSRNAPYGMYQSAADGRFLLANPACVKLLGCTTVDQILALDPRGDVFRDPADLDRLLAVATATGRVDDVEVDWKRPDGAVVSVRLTGHAVPSLAGAGREFEFVAEDVTARRSLERQLQVAQKMEVVGRLAGGIAHDFNNLLVAILGYSEMVASQLAEASPLRRPVDEIRKAGECAASLTRQLLAFSRGQVLDRKPLDLNEIVTSLVPMLRRLIGEDVVLKTSLDSRSVRVLGDRGQLEQILMNLVVNARDAMPHGGTVTLETRSLALVADGVPSTLSSGGPFSTLTVSDTGEGMTLEVEAHLFEPFFTTKSHSRGTGLGLSTVRTILTQSGGDVSVTSVLGHGSTFRVFLPSTDALPELSPSPATVPSARVPSETLLLVEDNATVRDIAREILQSAGYRIAEARDGEEALRVASEASEPFQLLVTDLILPDMTGLVLCERLQARFPDLRVLLTSGYTTKTLDLQGLTRSRVAFLPKPFGPEALLRKVREVLNESVTCSVA
jgi:PAS domain S-box-containing protein